MTKLMLAFFSVLLLTGTLATTGAAPALPATAATNSSAELDRELQKIMDLDDEAQAEVDQWIQQDRQFAAKGAGADPEQLRRRIQQRLEPVHKAYEDFISQHPNYARARVAYASFLSDTRSEEAAQEQLERALTIDTNNPAIYNNLAQIYAHIGPDVKKAFEYYEKAISLKPGESTYFHNLGTVVYLFRKDAKEYYQIDEAHVFAKAFGLYSNAMRLDPENFPLASDVAQTYYGVQPLPTDEALNAWTNAMHLANDDVELEGVYAHFARIKTLAGRFREAQAHLDAITNTMYVDLKARLQRNLNARQAKAQTNAPPEAKK